MKISSVQIKDLFFFGAIVILAILSIAVIKPFIGILVISLVLVELFHPVYYFLLKKTKSIELSSVLSTLFVIFLVIIPIAFVFVVAGNQALTIKDNIQNYIEANKLFDNGGAELTNKINEILGQLKIHLTVQEIDYKQTFIAIISTLAGTTSSIFSLLKDTINIFIDATFLIYTLYYLFREHGNLRKTFKKMSPLEDGLDDLFIDKFHAISKSVIKGSLVVGIAQAVLGGLAFWAAGISAPLFWTVIMFFLSILPLGSGFIWIPASLILIATNHPVEGIGLFIWGVAVISSVDNFIRSKLLQKDIQLHPLISFFSIIGGIQVFGMLGLIYGPLILILFLSLYSAYRHKYKP